MPAVLIGSVSAYSPNGDLLTVKQYQTGVVAIDLPEVFLPANPSRRYFIIRKADTKIAGVGLNTPIWFATEAASGFTKLFMAIKANGAEPVYDQYFDDKYKGDVYVIGTAVRPVEVIELIGA